MRTALLIGLIAVGLSTSAQAQTQRRPYDPPKPYELPKAYGTNPYDRDYSKTDTYENQSKQKRYDSNARDNDSYGSGAFGSQRSSRGSTWEPAGSQRDRSRACKPGLVC